MERVQEEARRAGRSLGRTDPCEGEREGRLGRKALSFKFLRTLGQG